MGTLLDLFFRNKKYNQEIESLEHEVKNLKKQVKDISEKAIQVCNLSERKLKEASENYIDLTRASNFIIEQGKVIFDTYDSIIAKIEILADLSSDKSLTDSEKNKNIAEYIMYMAKDIDICKKQKQLREQLNGGLGYGL
ncbi:hypothetical protein [Ruminococcus sp. Marseille-P6503]|uniref:hypothetical protein n=1 Tax=Ruminococcus sp. Marseille-P6503 TaxID=2364796 RepID=UPI000F546C2C|nr:hypothetical protein [Ruminococcus sp. Marseille-P6503]